MYEALFGLDELKLNDEDKYGLSWANLGFWEGNHSYSKAGMNLAVELGKSLKLSDKDRILDVGFGLGEQLLLWHSYFQINSIVGLNPSNIQNHYAKSRIAEEGLSDKIIIYSGNSRDIIQFDSNKFDKIIALDCAYHFDTRMKFVEDSIDLLRKDGELGMIDIFPTEKMLKWPQKIIKSIIAKFFHINKKNLITIREFEEEIYKMKIFKPEIIDISNNVFPGFCNYINKKIVKDKSGLKKMKITAILLRYLHSRDYIRAFKIILKKSC